jgi:hypothetical protein
MRILSRSAALFALLTLTLLTIQAQDVQSKFLKDAPTLSREQVKKNACGKWCKGSKVFFVGASTFEGAASYYATRNGIGREANPLFRDSDGFSVSRFAVASVGEYFIFEWLERKHSKAATVARFTLSGVKIVAGIIAVRIK